MNTFYIMSFSTGVLVRWPNTATLYSFESAYLSVEFSVLLWLCPTETPPMESKLHTFFFLYYVCLYSFIQEAFIVFILAESRTNC